MAQPRSQIDKNIVLREPRGRDQIENMACRSWLIRRYLPSTRKVGIVRFAKLKYTAENLVPQIETQT